MPKQFTIYLEKPDIEDKYNNLLLEEKNPNPDKDKINLLKKLKKTFELLSIDPRYPSLHSHEISALTEICGCKIFESYVENQTPAARRVFWMYGPIKNSIVIVGIETHRNDKNNSYKRIKLYSKNFN